MDWLWRLIGLRQDGPGAVVANGEPRALPLRRAATRGRRMDSLFNPLTGMGSSGDKSEVARPNPYVIPLNDEELRSLYNNSGIARRIVDILPEYATREGWTVVGESSAETKRLRIRAKVQEAMALAQLYGGAALLLVTEDDVPQRFRSRPVSWLAEPLDLNRVVRLAAIQVFDTFEASPLDEERDLRSPDYRGPSMWSFGAHGFNAHVHASRVIQFVGRRRIPSERWARGTFGGGVGSFNRQQNASILQAVYAELRQLAETMKAGAVLATNAQQTVYQIAGLDAIRAGDQAAQLVSKLKAAQQAASVLGATVIGPDDDFRHVAGTSTGFRDLSEGQMAMLSLVTGIPQMVLLGEQPSGMSTDGDASWKGFRLTVSSYQEGNRPQLERLYQVMAAAQDRDNTIDVDDPALTFAGLDEPTAIEQQQARLLGAQADALEISSGVLSPQEIREGRYGSDDGYQYELPALDPISDEEAEMRAQMARTGFGEDDGGPEPDAHEPRAGNDPPTPAK